MRLDHLKVKVKTLAAEAKIIRHAERQATSADRRCALAEHRRTVVRSEARSSLLAYGYLRGRAYRSMELTCHTEPLWDAVVKIIQRFGADPDSAPYGVNINGIKAWRDQPVQAVSTPAQAA